MVRAFIFPGQGSQAVGMGQALAQAFPIARHTLQEVDDSLEQRLSKLMAEGPEEDLILTENAQPALMAVSMAVINVLREQGGVDLGSACKYVAGHSLGEYSAHAAAGTFSLADTARLLKARGRAMQLAVPVGEGAMAALLGAELAQAAEIADEAAQGQICAPANDNAPGQVVLSGHKEAIDRAIEIAPDKGIRRAMLLPVSAPFHCALMAPAAETMAEALGQVQTNQPVVPVVANVTAAPTDEPEEIRDLLVRQVTDMVRWRECVIAMRDAEVDTLVEIGAGKVLTGLAKRIDKELTAMSVETPDDIDNLIKTL